MKQRSKNKLRILPLLYIMLLFLGGCSINYSMSGIDLPHDVTTVSVQYFPNRAPIVRPMLSQDFTDALKDKLQAKTRLVLVSSNGDVNFEGEIKRYSTEPMNVQAGDVAAQNKFTIGVQVKYTNYKYPEQNFTQTFTRFETYNSSENFESVAPELTQEIIELLLEDILNKAFINW